MFYCSQEDGNTPLGWGATQQNPMSTGDTFQKFAPMLDTLQVSTEICELTRIFTKSCPEEQGGGSFNNLLSFCFSLLLCFPFSSTLSVSDVFLRFLCFFLVRFLWFFLSLSLSLFLVLFLALSFSLSLSLSLSHTTLNKCNNTILLRQTPCKSKDNSTIQVNKATTREFICWF